MVVGGPSVSSKDVHKGIDVAKVIFKPQPTQHVPSRIMLCAAAFHAFESYPVHAPTAHAGVEARCISTTSQRASAEITAPPPETLFARRTGRTATPRLYRDTRRCVEVEQVDVDGLF